MYNLYRSGKEVAVHREAFVDVIIVGTMSIAFADVGGETVTFLLAELAPSERESAQCAGAACARVEL